MTSETAGARAPPLSGDTTWDALPAAARPGFARLQRLLTRGGVLVAIAFVALTAYALFRLHAIAIESAERHVVNLGQTIAEQTARAVQAADLTVLSAKSALGASPAGSRDARAIHDLLAARVHAVPQVAALYVVDAAGRIVHSSQSLAAPVVSVRDADYVLAHRGAAATEAYVSAPQPDPLSGRPAFYLSRAMRGAGGELAGVVVALIDPAYFVSFYQSLEFAPGMAVALARADGTLIARHPKVPDAVGRVLHGYDAGATGAGRLSRAQHLRGVDGQPRIVAGRRLADYPLSIYVSVTRSGALNEWYRHTLIFGVFAAVVIVSALACYLALFSRELARERALTDALQRSEARFRNLTQLSSDWYWAQDSALCFVAVTGEAAWRAGFSPRACIGRPLWALDGVERIDGDWDAHRADLAQRREFRDLRLRRTDADGRIHHVTFSGMPLFDGAGIFQGYEGVATDVSIRVEAEARGTRVAREIEMITGNVPSAVFRFRIAADGACTFPFVSEHVRNLCGVDAVAVMQDFRRLYRLVKPQFRDALRRSVSASMAALSPWDFEFEIRAGDGRMRWLRGQATPCREADGAVAWDGVLTDITERKRAELEIVRLTVDLETRVAERTREYQSANAELESFAYSVSHDLRAPLRAVNSFSQILLEDYGGALDATARGHLERLRMAGRRMGELVDALLGLSRVTRRSFLRDRVDVTRLAHAVIDDLRQLHPERTVEVAVTPGLVAHADPALLRLLLENLIGNAWKFTAKATPARIEIGAETRPGKMVYHVRDNGVGFDMAYAGKLFQPFQRLHDSAQFEGTGIGLATVRRIVQRHGGHVWADAAIGGGAVVYFTLTHTAEHA